MRYLILAFLLPLSALADEAAGKVVRVQDGDTLTVLVDRTQLKVRLLDIDAPELGQPFGRRSRQSLASICAERIGSRCLEQQGPLRKNSRSSHLCGD
jgi:endonuclease YncB( thermonuclease family)